MAKYDIKNGIYARFYKDEAFLQNFMDESALLQTNHKFWTTQFSIDPNLTPTGPDGVASFSCRMTVKDVAPMADMRAPLAHGKALDKKGTEFYTATIPDFISPATYENAFERAYDENYFDAFGRDKELVKQWVESVQTQVDSLNQTLSNMAAQLLSTGVINYKYGRSFQSYLQHVPIPKENIVKGGTNTWTTRSCKIFDQMYKIETEFRMRTGYEGAMKWQIPLKMYRDVFMTNDQVKEWFKAAKEVVGITLPTINILSEDDVVVAARKYGRISPIEVIVEKQKDWSGDVSGWKEEIAVLRPSGYAGQIKRTDILDEIMHKKWGAKGVEKTFANIGESGIFKLCNITRDNADYKEWASEVYFSGVPSLSEYLYHVLVDTTQAGDGPTTITIE